MGDRFHKTMKSSLPLVTWAPFSLPCSCLPAITIYDSALSSSKFTILYVIPTHSLSLSLSETHSLVFFKIHTLTHTHSLSLSLIHSNERHKNKINKHQTRNFIFLFLFCRNILSMPDIIYKLTAGRTSLKQKQTILQ